MPNQISYSTEMLANYDLSTIMPPDASFQAIQNVDGLSILLTIGSDHALYAVVESPGSESGWVKHNLSAQATLGGAAITVKKMAIAQNQTSGLIDIVLIAAASPADQVFAMLGCSPTDLSWMTGPSWAPVPYDDASHPMPANWVISGVFISQASDRQYLVIDALRDPSQPQQIVSRYFVDPSKTVVPGQAWLSCDVAADMDAAAIRTCLGRRKGDAVDGFYTIGTAAAPDVVIFQPLYNAFNPKVAPNPARLTLPAGSIASALDVTGANDATDLYVSAGKQVVYFAAGAQTDRAQGVVVLNDPSLQDVTQLNVFTAGDLVTLLALTRADQVVRAQAPAARASDPAAWSPPLTIFSGVSTMAAYLNRGDLVNTLFLATGQDRLMRASLTSENGTWRTENILLPAPDTASATKRNSFTTRIQVLDEGSNPVAHSPVQLRALKRTGLFINNVYYVVTPTAIAVATDAMGTLNVVEWCDGLAATPLQIDGFGNPIAINPMSQPFERARGLNSAGALGSATISNSDGTTTPLVRSDASQEDIEAVGRAVAAMSTVYNSLPADGSTASGQHPAALARARAGTPVGRLEVHATVRVGAVAMPHSVAVTHMDISGFDWLTVPAGDLLEKLKSAGESVLQIVKDTATGAWHFVASIGGKLFAFVFDAVEKVMASLEAVFRAIVTAIEDFIRYLQFLFAWQDILRTKDVIKKVIRLSMLVVFDQITTIKSQADDALNNAKTRVNNWAAIKSDGWKSSVGNAGQPLGFSAQGVDIAKVATAPAMFLVDHLLDYVARSTGNESPSGPGADDPLNTALTLVNDPQGALLSLSTQVQSQLFSGSTYASLDLAAILAKITAIVVDGVLNLAQTVLDTLLDALVAIGRSALDALDTPVRIPLLSDVLEDLFGVSTDFSMLDVFALIAAVPATLGFKLLTGSAPFASGDAFHDRLMQANTPADLKRLFPPPARFAIAAASEGETESWSPIALDDNTNRTATIIGNTVSWLGGMCAGVVAIPGLLTNEPLAQQYEKAMMVSGIFTTFMAGMGALFIDRRYPIQNTDISRLKFAGNALTVAGKIGFFAYPYRYQGPQRERMGKTCKLVGAGFDSLCALLGMVATSYHFYELSQAPASSSRSEAIIDETATLTSQLARWGVFGARMDQEPASKLIIVGSVAGLTFITAFLRLAIVFVVAGNPPSAA